VTGSEVQFSVNFTTPFDLLAGHYFFVPQVEVTDPAGDFFGSRHRGRLCHRERLSPPASPIFRVGHEIICWTLTGCGSAPTSLAPIR
jgi:hypothetical protein